MLRLTFRLIIAAFLLAGWLLAASAIHVLVLPGWNFGLVPKDHLSFTDTYVDARNWTAQDAVAHPALVKRLVEAGRADWLSSVLGTPGESLDQKLADLIKPAEADKGEKAKAKLPAVPKGAH